MISDKKKEKSENQSDVNSTVQSDNDVCNVNVPEDSHINANKQLCDEKKDTLSNSHSIETNEADSNSDDKRLERKIEELKSSDSKWDHMKAWLLGADTSKIENLSDKLNDATKSKSFGFIIIIIAIFVAFMFK